MPKYSMMPAEVRRRLCETFRKRLARLEGWEQRLATWERDCRDVGADVLPPGFTRASDPPQRMPQDPQEKEEVLRAVVAHRANQLLCQERRLRALVDLLADESIQGEELDRRAVDIEQS